MSLVKRSACTKTASKLVSANRIASLISSASVVPAEALNSDCVLRMTKFYRLGVGIFMVPRNSLRCSDRALERVAGVAMTDNVDDTAGWILVMLLFAAVFVLSHSKNNKPFGLFQCLVDCLLLFPVERMLFLLQPQKTGCSCLFWWVMTST